VLLGTEDLEKIEKLEKENKLLKNKLEEATGSEHSISSFLLGNVYIHTVSTMENRTPPKNRK